MVKKQHTKALGFIDFLNYSWIGYWRTKLFLVLMLSYSWRMSWRMLQGSGEICVIHWLVDNNSPQCFWVWLFYILVFGKQPCSFSVRTKAEAVCASRMTSNLVFSIPFSLGLNLFYKVPRHSVLKHNFLLSASERTEKHVSKQVSFANSIYLSWAAQAFT